MTIKPVTYLLALVLFVSFGCKKKDASTPEPAPTTTGSNPADLTAETAEYVKFDLAGTSYSYTPPTTGTWYSSSGAPILMTGPPLNLANVNVNFYNSGTIVFSINKNDSTRETGSSASNSFYINMFKTGSYPYTTSYTDFNKRIGAGLSFKDTQTNKIWNSQNYSGNTFQAGSAFTINKSINYTKSNFQYVKIKANFNCKVYNGTDSLQVTNGEILISLFK